MRVRRRQPDMPALARPYAKALALQVEEWRRSGSPLQRAEVLAYVEEHGPTQIGLLADALGLSCEAVRAAAHGRVERVKNRRGVWREVVC